MSAKKVLFTSLISSTDNWRMTVRRLIALFGIMAVVATTSGAAIAQGTSHICAYTNDNVYDPNVVEGYKIGPGNATAHVGPYSTNGNGYDGSFYFGGLGAARVTEGDLYMEDLDSNNITHFKINKADCTLTKDPMLYPLGDTQSPGLASLAITPDGSTLFEISTIERGIYSHTIAANGSLGAPFPETSNLSTYPLDSAVSPDGKTLVVGYGIVQQVCAYPISGGHLGTSNCQSTAGQPSGISIDPSSNCVYAGETNISASEIAAFTLTGSVLGTPTDYNPFGPGIDSAGVLVNYDDKAIYMGNPRSAQMTAGSITSGCKLTYTTIFQVGGDNHSPSQIAQAQNPHRYVVLGDVNFSNPSSMRIFHAYASGKVTRSGKLPLPHSDPSTVVVVGVK
jgi:hypothetical protein